jgi:ATP-dependent Clp protease ATP-binding subunit ClpC
MNGYNFTERVRKALQLAREEAFALHHEYVGTEHILVGLCREDGGVATSAMRNLSVEPEDVITSVLETVKHMPDTGPRGPDLPYTSRAKRSLELAMTEARELNHSYVGTEHMLLGLMREERGIAAQVLAQAGLTITDTRAEVLRLLGGEQAGLGYAEKHTLERKAAITLVVEHPDGRIEAKKFRRTGDAVSFLNGLEY